MGFIIPLLLTLADHKKSRNKGQTNLVYVGIAGRYFFCLVSATYNLSNLDIIGTIATFVDVLVVLK